MDANIFAAAGEALSIIADPERILMLCLGVVLGLVLGIIPGLGATVGIAILLPFTFSMDSYSAFAFLLGLLAVTGLTDQIPAIIFGVPGSSAAQATILDGHEMAKRGEAGRALSAAYMASLLGGIAGAFLMAISIPMIRPFVLMLGAPELLAFAMFGISMVALLSGRSPIRGLVAGLLGVMLSLIGTSPQTGEHRWTFDQIYLWEGLPLVPAILGLFALPELCDLAVRRTAISDASRYNLRTGMTKGIVDVLRSWWLVVRCSWIGAVLGAIPGVAPSVVSWVAYGYALSTEKGARETFSKGDVRGVIAPESANNSSEGGQFVPAIAFGVPASTAMALMIGVFMSHGLVLGPKMLTENLHVTYTMVWSLALANVVGAALCFAFSGQFAKLATVRFSIIIPVILCIAFLGAFQGSRSWGDLFTLVGFGLLGWIMKQLKWPRPPLILGLILGSMIERYGFITFQRYGFDWIFRPVALVLFAVALFTFVRPLFRLVRSGSMSGLLRGFQSPRFRPASLFTVAIIVLAVVLLIDALGWNARSRMVPVPIAIATLCFAVLSLISDVFFGAASAKIQSVGETEAHKVEEALHMDVVSEFDGIAPATVLRRSIAYFGWILGFMVSMWLIGLLPTIPLFIIAYMRAENREPWPLILTLSAVMVIGIYYVFGQLLGVPWPPTLLGSLVPELRVVPSV